MGAAASMHLSNGSNDRGSGTGDYAFPGIRYPRPDILGPIKWHVQHWSSFGLLPIGVVDPPQYHIDCASYHTIRPGVDVPVRYLEMDQQGGPKDA